MSVVLLTDDDTSDGPSLHDVSGLLSEHTLAPLQQSNAALYKGSVAQFRTATVGFSHCHKPTNLQTDGEKGGGACSNITQNAENRERLAPRDKTGKTNKQRCPCIGNWHTEETLTPVMLLERSVPN